MLVVCFGRRALGKPSRKVCVCSTVLSSGCERAVVSDVGGVTTGGGQVQLGCAVSSRTNKAEPRNVDGLLWEMPARQRYAVCAWLEVKCSRRLREEACSTERCVCVRVWVSCLLYRREHTWDMPARASSRARCGAQRAISCAAWPRWRRRRRLEVVFVFVVPLLAGCCQDRKRCVTRDDQSLRAGAAVIPVC